MGDETPVFDEVPGASVERAAGAAEPADVPVTGEARIYLASTDDPLAEAVEASVDIAAERERFLAANPQFSGARVDVTRDASGDILVTCHGW